MNLFIIHIYLFLIALGLFISSSLFDYSLYVIFGKDFPWYVDIIGGIACSSFIVLVSFICWIIELCGVAIPFVS